MNKKSAPLKIWLILTLVFFITESVFYFSKTSLDIKYGQIQRVYKKKQATLTVNYLKKNFNPDKKTFKVVVIGSSLSALGVNCNERLYFKEKFHKDIEIFKVFSYGYRDNLKFLTRELQFFDLLANLKPDMVIFENDLLAFDLINKETEFKTYDLPALNKFIFQTLRNILLYLKKTNDYTYEPCNPLEPEVIKPLHYKINPRRIKTFEEIAFLHPYLNILNKSGTKLIFLDLPRPKIVEKEIHSGEQEKEFQKLLAKYTKSFNISYWKYTRPLSFIYFIDHGHLNKQGRDIFSDWLIEKIAKETEK